MERWLNRLERRFGRYALSNITYFLVGAQAVGFVVLYARPELIERLTLDTDRVLDGELWRTFTWLAIPSSTSPLWILFSLYWLYIMGSALEEHWGAFKFQLFFGTGILATLAVALITRSGATNTALVMSLFLAFATRWPDYQINLFMILPIRVKWLALVDGAFILYNIATAPAGLRLLPLVAIANYLLFFGQDLYSLLLDSARHAGRAAERGRFKQDNRVTPPRVRQCAICGVTDEDPSVDIRLCTCARCGEYPRELCLPHARNH